MKTDNRVFLAEPIEMDGRSMPLNGGRRSGAANLAWQQLPAG
jgi:hypothetical protein